MAPGPYHLVFRNLCPEALSTRSEALEENEWFFLVGLLENAIAKFDEFRNTEGKILKRELTKNLNSIEENLQKVIPFE